MAYSAMAKSAIEVALFCDKEPQPKMNWEKWFSTAKLAIEEKDNVQVNKLLRLNPGNSELEYPHEPMYEPPTSDETTAKKRQ